MFYVVAGCKENRAIPAGGTTYVYDGDTSTPLSAGGNRILKVVGTERRTYWHNAAAGTVLGEMVDGAVDREYIYLPALSGAEGNGERLLRIRQPEGWVRHHWSDHLGSLRLEIRSGGAIQSRHDYYPFGTERTTASSMDSHKFTGQERDAETGLPPSLRLRRAGDYFIARHYASNFPARSFGSGSV